MKNRLISSASRSLLRAAAWAAFVLCLQPASARAASVNVNGSHNILLRNLVLGGDGNGLVVSRGSTVTLQGLLITENLGAGMNVNLGSVVNLGGALDDQSVTVSDNEGNGIGSDASVLAVAGGLTIEDNGGVGLNVIGGRVSFNASVVAGVPRVTTIEGHTLGVNVAGAGSVNFNGPNRIRNNGATSEPDPQFRGGVRIGTVSRVQFDGGNEITGNTGIGVFLDFNGALSLTNAVVSNNTEGGVRVARSSVGGFGLGNTFGGNGGPHISCDDTSLIHGTGLTGFGKGRAREGAFAAERPEGARLAGTVTETGVQNTPVYMSPESTVSQRFQLPGRMPS